MAQTETGSKAARRRRTRSRLQDHQPATSKPTPALLAGRMTCEEAGRLIGRSASTVWRWARSGRRCGSETVFLECVDLGGTVFTTEESLLGFAADCARALRRREAGA